MRIRWMYKCEMHINCMRAHKHDSVFKSLIFFVVVLLSTISRLRLPIGTLFKHATHTKARKIYILPYFMHLCKRKVNTNNGKWLAATNEIFSNVCVYTMHYMVPSYHNITYESRHIYTFTAYWHISVKKKKKRVKNVVAE